MIGLNLFGFVVGIVFDVFGDGVVDVVGGDLGFIVVFVSISVGGIGWFGVREGFNFNFFNFFVFDGGNVVGLGEEGFDLGFVDEVEGGVEEIGEEEVEEDVGEELVIIIG